MNLSKLAAPLGQIVRFDDQELEVYQEDFCKPAEGIELNK